MAKKEKEIEKAKLILTDEEIKELNHEVIKNLLINKEIMETAKKN